MNNRWQRAVERGNDEGLVILKQSESEYLVSSSTNRNRFYDVVVEGSVANCSCQVRDGVCKHRAVVLDLLGLLGMQPEIPHVSSSALPEVTEEEVEAFMRNMVG